MNLIIKTQKYNKPNICEKEILRYAGVKTASAETENLLKATLNEALKTITYTVCYCELPLTITDDVCDFGCLRVKSKDLKTNLEGAHSVILLCATIGIEMDRLIAKYSRLSPSKALMLQAIGAERIEALCDAFTKDYEREKGVFLKPRFSPGYGDLNIDVQKDIFAVTDCAKKIGLTLNDSMLMSPSKSVTAFIGISSMQTSDKNNKCSLCKKTDCAFRGAV